MPLAAGARLGPYEIIASMGSGGMGEVWKARDSRLDRVVAVKVLPEAAATDPERVARFEREARTLAALNHPNIAAIYGVEETPTSRAIVMELVDGETLADRIARGPVPLDETMAIARQIIDALDAAHQRDIVHRDLKPANIALTVDATVKILDFGLAKLTQPPDSPATPPLTVSPTMLSPAMTNAGVILGTAAYMSPEQARGKAVDKRADIWAFGVVMYEMLVGSRLFDGETVSDTLAAVLTQTPEWDGVPARVRPLLRRCLEKNPKQRLRDIGDALPLLEETTAPSGRTGPHRRPWLWPGIAALFAMATAVALWAPWRATEPEKRPLMRLQVDLGPDVSLSESNSGPRVIISPDGTRLVYYSGNPGRLFTRKLDEDKSVELPGTEGDIPFFSPDGQWIGFTTSGATKKVSVAGGAVIPVANIAGPGASWSENGDIFAGIARIPAGGGAPVPVKQSMLGYVPQALPGGKAVLITTRKEFTDEETAAVEVLSLADGTTKMLARGTTGRYVPSGHLLYVNKGTLFAVPFDVRQLETRGNPVPVLNDVAHVQITGTGQYDVSKDRHGTLVYLRASDGESGPLSTIQLVDLAGNIQPLIGKPGPYFSPRFSPDGKQLFYVTAAMGALVGGQVMALDLRRGQGSPLTTNNRYRGPLPHPSGRYVLLSSAGQGIVWTRADGAGDPQPLNEDRRNILPWSITRDGKWLAYTTGPRQIEIVPLREENGQLKAGDAERLVGNEPAFSQDGRWLAYSSFVGAADGGRGRATGLATEDTQLYVRAFRPGSSDQSPRVFIATNSGEPKWLPDGRTLLFRSGDQIMAVDYTVKGEEFIPGKPRVWMAKLGGAGWALDPANSRVAIVMPQDSPKQRHEVTLLLNFFDYLREHVPVGQ